MSESCPHCKKGIIQQVLEPGPDKWVAVERCLVCRRSALDPPPIIENPEAEALRERAKRLAMGDSIWTYPSEPEKSTDRDKVVIPSTNNRLEGVVKASPLIVPEKTVIKKSTETIKGCTALGIDTPHGASTHPQEELSKMEEKKEDTSPGRQLRNLRMDVLGMSCSMLANRLIHPKSGKPPHSSVISAWELNKIAIPNWAQVQIEKIWQEAESKKDAEELPRPERTKELSHEAENVIQKTISGYEAAKKTEERKSVWCYILPFDPELLCQVKEIANRTKEGWLLIRREKC